MSMRMKSRYYTGLTKTGIYDPMEPVLPGSFMENERKALNAKWGKGVPAKFEESRRALYGGNKRRMPRNGPVLLTMHLGHGDIVIMHGSHMQKYYEVSFRHHIFKRNTNAASSIRWYHQERCASH